MSELRVNYIGVAEHEPGKSPAPGNGGTRFFYHKDKGERAWRISAYYEGDWLTVSAAFPNKKTAEQAMKALHAAGITTTADCIKAGGKRCWQIMAEAMAW